MCARAWAWCPASKTNKKKEAYVIGSTGNRQRSGQTSEVKWTNRKFQAVQPKARPVWGLSKEWFHVILSKNLKSQYKTSKLLTTAVQRFHRRDIYKTPEVAASPGEKRLLTSVSWGQVRSWRFSGNIRYLRYCFLFCLEMGDLLIKWLTGWAGESTEQLIKSTCKVSIWGASYVSHM